jgi:hypothetical protein
MTEDGLYQFFVWIKPEDYARLDIREFPTVQGWAYDEKEGQLWITVKANSNPFDVEQAGIEFKIEQVLGK